MIRRKRRSYLDHFTRNAAGEYIYEGAHYTFQPAGKSRKRALTELWLLCGGAALAILAGGCIPAPGVGNCPYVLVPYVAAIITSFAALWSLGQLTAGGDPMREYVYHDSVEKLPGRTLAAAICAALALLGETVFLIRSGAGERLAFGLVFLALMALAAGTSLGGRRAVSKMEWTK